MKTIFGLISCEIHQQTVDKPLKLDLGSCGKVQFISFWLLMDIQQSNLTHSIFCLNQCRTYHCMGDSWHPYMHTNPKQRIHTTTMVYILVRPIGNVLCSLINQKQMLFELQGQYIFYKTHSIIQYHHHQQHQQHTPPRVAITCQPFLEIRKHPVFTK